LTQTVPAFSRREAVRAADVAGPHAGRQAVGGAVGDTQGVLLVLEGNDRCDRTEDLLLGDAHLVAHPGKDGGLDEIAGLAAPRTAGDQRGALIATDLDIVENALHLHLGDQRPHGGRGFERIADAGRLRPRRQPLHHLVMYL